MNGYQVVMKAYRQLIGSEYSLTSPKPGAIQEITQIGCNLPGGNADAALRHSVLPRPGPDVAKHSFVQVFEKTLLQQVSARFSIFDRLVFQGH